MILEYYFHIDNQSYEMEIMYKKTCNTFMHQKGNEWFKISFISYDKICFFEDFAYLSLQTAISSTFLLIISQLS